MSTPITPVEPVGAPSYLAGQVPAIVPFTIREAPSLEHIVQQMRYWITNTLVPYINENIQGLQEAWGEEVAELTANWEALSIQLIAQVQEIADTVTNEAEAAQAAQLAAEAARDAAEQYANSVVAFQDGAVAGLVDDDNSLTRAAMDAAYASNAAFVVVSDTINTGRLSEDALNTNYANKATQTAVEGRLSDATLKSEFPIYRQEVGGVYPPRVDGALNIFVGETDPGLAMGEDDVWTNPDVTTLASVTSAASNSSDPLYDAIVNTASGNRVPLPLYIPAGSTVTKELVGESPNRMSGTMFPDGTTGTVFGSIPVPPGWNTCRVVIRWTQTVGGLGSARLYCDVTPYTASAGAVSGERLETSSGVPTVGLLKLNQFASAATLTEGEALSVVFGRLGASGADSFSGAIYVIDSWIERLS